jgi:hypothetical protein
MNISYFINRGRLRERKWFIRHFGGSKFELKESTRELPRLLT